MSLMTAQVQSTDPSKDEALIETLVEEQTVSWNKGDAHATDERPLSNVTLSFSRVYLKEVSERNLSRSFGSSAKMWPSQT
jgi:hypothetical protein